MTNGKETVNITAVAAFMSDGLTAALMHSSCVRIY